MIIEIIVMCVLTEIDPFYDCNEKWTIYLHDDAWKDVNNMELMLVPQASHNYSHQSKSTALV
ncbi:MAG TPA: hypothetical protein VLD64_05360 [Nitrosarchaeum sp.]|nr:hypothetical protein [Nitrosarchaeum sp.]